MEKEIARKREKEIEKRERRRKPWRVSSPTIHSDFLLCVPFFFAQISPFPFHPLPE